MERLQANSRSRQPVARHYTTGFQGRRNVFGFAVGASLNFQKEKATGGTRTRDLPLTRRLLCRLSYGGLRHGYYTNGKPVSKPASPAYRRFACSNKDAHRATEDTEYPLDKVKNFSVFSVPP